MAKFYAIKEGYDSSNKKKVENIVVNTWDECLKYVKGVKGAKYKSFKTLEEARNFFDNSFSGFKKTDKFIKAFDKICFENYYSDDSENLNIKGIAASFNYICFYLLELAIKHIVRNYETGYIDNQTYKEGIKGCLDYFSKVCVKDENDKIYEIDKEKIKRIIKKNISKC